MGFGQLLRETRTKRGFTQKQIAEFLQVSPNYISDIECERRDIGNVKRLLVWAGYLGISNRELLVNEGTYFK